MSIVMSGFGLLALIGIAYALSVERQGIRWRPVVMGIVLQLILALFVLKTDPGQAIFGWARDVFNSIIGYSEDGSEFVFGELAKVPKMGPILSAEPNAEGVLVAENINYGLGWLFFIHVASTIIFVSALMAILYHLGIMQRIVYAMAVVMHRVMRVSGSESLATAANVFVGQTEAPLTVRPYLAGMTSSELMALMTGGMATVAGGVLAAYMGMGIDGAHLLTASVMSAPAALAIAKILTPEVERSETSGDVPLEIKKADHNVLDAACRGAGEGLKLALNVLAMLMAVIALMAMLNAILKWMQNLVLGNELAMLHYFWREDPRYTLESLLALIFAPLAWVIGVPWEDAGSVGELLGTKIILNEFVAYGGLADMVRDEVIGERARIISTYALCGFANFSSIAIQIGGIGALEPRVRPKLARLGFLAMIGGTLAALMTATIAGAFV